MTHSALAPCVIVITLVSFIFYFNDVDIQSWSIVDELATLSEEHTARNLLNSEFIRVLPDFSSLFRHYTPIERVLPHLFLRGKAAFATLFLSASPFGLLNPVFWIPFIIPSLITLYARGKVHVVLRNVSAYYSYFTLFAIAQSRVFASALTIFLPTLFVWTCVLLCVQSVAVVSISDVESLRLVLCSLSHSVVAPFFALYFYYLIALAVEAITLQYALVRDVGTQELHTPVAAHSPVRSAAVFHNDVTSPATRFAALARRGSRSVPTLGTHAAHAVPSLAASPAVAWTTACAARVARVGRTATRGAWLLLRCTARATCYLLPFVVGLLLQWDLLLALSHSSLREFVVAPPRAIPSSHSPAAAVWALYTSRIAATPLLLIICLLTGVLLRWTWAAFDMLFLAPVSLTEMPFWHRWRAHVGSDDSPLRGVTSSRVVATPVIALATEEADSPLVVPLSVASHTPSRGYADIAKAIRTNSVKRASSTAKRFAQADVQEAQESACVTALFPHSPDARPNGRATSPQLASAFTSLPMPVYSAPRALSQARKAAQDDVTPGQVTAPLSATLLAVLRGDRVDANNSSPLLAPREPPRPTEPTAVPLSAQLPVPAPLEAVLRRRRKSPDMPRTEEAPANSQPVPKRRRSMRLQSQEPASARLLPTSDSLLTPATQTTRGTRRSSRGKPAATGLTLSVIRGARAGLAHVEPPSERRARKLQRLAAGDTSDDDNQEQELTKAEEKVVEEVEHATGSAQLGEMFVIVEEEEEDDMEDGANVTATVAGKPRVSSVPPALLPVFARSRRSVSTARGNTRASRQRGVQSRLSVPRAQRRSALRSSRARDVVAVKNMRVEARPRAVNADIKARTTRVGGIRLGTQLSKALRRRRVMLEDDVNEGSDDEEWD